MQLTDASIQELQQFALLQGFTTTELQSLADVLTERTFKQGECLFKEGDVSKEVYLIRQGQVEVSRTLTTEQTQQVLTHLGAGDEVGELSLIDGAPRSASVRAVAETQVFVLNPDHLPITLMLLSRLISNLALVGTKKLREQKAEVVADTVVVETPLLEELQHFSLFKDLSTADLSRLADIIETRELAAGEYLFQENDVSNEVYLIRSGSVEICKQGSDAASYVVATVPTGQEVGELALVNGEPRSASARTAEDSSVFVLNIETLPNNLILLGRLISNIALTSPTKLRQSNTEHVGSLKRELALARTQNEFGQFLVYAVTIFSIGTFVNHILNTYIQSDEIIYTQVFGWSYLIILLVPSLITVWAMKLPLSELGVTLNNWQKSLREGLIFSFFMIFVAIIIAGSLRYFELVPAAPLNYSFLYVIPIYFLHSALQELLARGITQSTLQRILNDERGIKAVFLTSVMFGLFHIHFGLVAVFSVFFSSLVFGAFYLRHHNLIGVTILHGSTGVVAIIAGVL